MKHLKLFENFDQNEVFYHGTKSEFDNFKIGSDVATPTYGGTDDNGLGIFFTDNMTMAKWFADRSKYDMDKTERYIDVPGPGRVVSAKLDIKNPWILNDQIPNAGENSDEDTGQDYFQVIKKEGGADKFRARLIKEGYDAVIVRNANTNYYEDGGYDIIVVFDPKQIKIISKNVL